VVVLDKPLKISLEGSAYTLLGSSLIHKNTRLKMQKHLPDLFISDEEKKVYNLTTNGNVIKCFSSSLMLQSNKLVSF